MTKIKQEMSLLKLIELYSSEQTCRDTIVQMRWPDGVRCPRCNSEKIRHSYTRGQFNCGSCGYIFSPTSGTIFADSHLSLKTWFIATYLLVTSQNSISASQMANQLELTYKSAWYLCSRIRAALADTDTQLAGVVECDETWIGGQTQGMGRAYHGNKALVAGAIERGGKAVLKVIEHRDKSTLESFVNAHVSPAARVYTDELPSYNSIATQTVNHSRSEFVNGDCHTGTIDGLFDVVKSSIPDNVSDKHLSSYLNEVTWKFNHKNSGTLFRDTLKKLICTSSLPYQKLIKSA